MTLHRFGDVLKMRTQTNVNERPEILQAKADYLDRLLDEAKAVLGSDYQIAKVLKTGRQTVSDWRAGRRPCPPGDVALLAEIAGYDPTAWTARAVVQGYAGTEKGALISNALKKALAATGGVIATSGTKAAAVLSVSAKTGLFDFIRCIPL